MKKVLYIASTQSHILHFHLPYLQTFQENGWEVHCACGCVTGEIPYTDEVLELPFEKKITALKNFRVANILHRRIVKQKYDLIIVHTSLAAFFTRLALVGMKNRPKLINMVHGYLFDEETSPLKRTLLLTAERMTAAMTDLLITMNHWDNSTAHQYRLCSRIAEVPGVGVNFDRLDRQENAQLRQKLGIGQDKFVLLYPAEFSARKSHDILLCAMLELPSNVVLVLPGDGDLIEECKDIVEELELQNRVFFPGYVTDMGAWYKMADCAISSSRSEGLPFNIMEAMHSGLPVIASKVKGHVDLIRNGENGLTYEYGDWVSCAEAVAKLMINRPFAERLAKQAVEDVERFDLKYVHPKIMELYLSVL